MAALAIVPIGADLHLHAVHVEASVDDQRAEVPADLQRHELGVFARGVVLSVMLAREVMLVRANM